MRHLICVLYVVFVPVVCLPQQVQSNYFPDYYSSSFLEYQALINPAFTSNGEKLSLNTLYKSRTGLLNEVAFMTAYADIAIKPQNEVTQVARVLFQNEQEGPYISSPRFYGNYAIRIPIGEDLSIAAGLALGMSSLSFSAPSGMGKARVLDGSVGGIVKYRKTELGIASYQIFNNSDVAISSSLLFKRFYQFYLQSEKELSPFVSLKGNIFWRPQPLYDLANATAMISYNETITIGVMYQLKRGTSFLGSIQVNKDKKPFLINFSYNSLLLSSLLVSTASFEVGLQYRIKQ